MVKILKQPAPQQVTFETMPAFLQTMYSDFAAMRNELREFIMQQPVNEPPISSKELMLRLAISEPTVIRMRKRGDIPFLEVCGNYRYIWTDVLKALESKKKGAKYLISKSIAK